MFNCRLSRNYSTKSLLFGLIFAIFALSSVAAAQEPFRVGQKVEVNINDQWVEGRVLRIPGANSALVRAVVGRKPQSGIVPFDRLRIPGVGKGEAQPSTSPRTPRTWTDSTGSFRIEATYVETVGDAVSLRKPDGSTISVAIDRLSREDQQYLARMSNSGGAAGADLAVDSPVEVLWGSSWYPATVLQSEPERYFVRYDGHGSNWDEWVGPDRIRPRATPPVAIATQPAGAAPGSVPSTAARPLDIPSVVCDLRGVAPIPIDAKMPIPTEVAVASQVDTPYPQGRVLLPKLDTFEEFGGFLPTGEPGGTVLVAITRSSPQNKTARLLWCDLKSGSMTREEAVSGCHQLLAGSRRAGWLLTLDARDTKRMTVWRWPAGDKPPQAAYGLSLNNDYPSAFANDFTRAWMAGPDLAVLENGGGRIVAWNLNQQRVERVWDGIKAAVSPTGLVAASGSEGIGLFDSMSGEQTGFWSTAGLSASSLAFSPRGASLACLTSNALKVLDLQSGDVVFDGSLPRMAWATSESPLWIGEQHLMIAHQYLLDLNSQMILWQYTDRSGFRGLEHMDSLGNALAYVSADQPALCSIELPHAAARDSVAAIDVRQLYALGPGGSVSLQMSGLDPALRAAVEKSTAQAGWKVVAGAPVTIVASVKKGQAETATFHEGLSGAGAGSQVTFTPTISEVDVQVAGESVWGCSSQSGLPTMLISTQGQSTQDAMRAYERPNAEFFASIPFPRQIVHPKFAQGLGKSELNSTGIGASWPVR